MAPPASVRRSLSSVSLALTSSSGSAVSIELVALSSSIRSFTTCSRSEKLSAIVHPRWRHRLHQSTRECPLWVISRHRVAYASCPLFPSKQTFVSASGMSAKCHEQTSAKSSSELWEHQQYPRTKWTLDRLPHSILPTGASTSGRWHPSEACDCLKAGSDIVHC